MAATTSQENTNKVSTETDDQTRGGRLAAKKAARAAQKAADKGRQPLVQSKFTAATAQLGHLLAEYRSLLLIALGATVVVAGIIWAWIFYSAKTDREASDLLKKAVTTSLAPIQNPAEGDIPADPETEPFDSAQARATAAAKDFNAVASGYPKASVVAWARVGEGKALFELGKYAEARKAFEEAINLSGRDAFVKYGALEGMGIALKAEKNYQEASKQFQAIAKLADGAYKPYADYYLAQVSLAQGQKDLAIKLLGQLLTSLDRMSPDQRIHFNFVTIEATAKLLELGVNPDKLKAELGAASSSKKSGQPIPGSAKP
jgi:tetratricopeptide (TPR) repeat protein